MMMSDFDASFRIRRVKCDLARPSCGRCQSGGRKCDGYRDTPHVFQIEFLLVNRAKKCKSVDPGSTSGGYGPRNMNAESNNAVPDNLGPLMVLPMIESTQTGAMSFFQHISIQNFDEYQRGESWQQTLMFFAQTVPSVRHAATALGFMHRACLHRESTKDIHELRQAHGELLEREALIHYNRAIQLVLSQDRTGDSNIKAITVLVCHLFNCFDHLAGNAEQAMMHLRGGVEIVLTIDRTMHDTRPSGIRTLVGQITRQMRRLDWQAATYLPDWTPADLQNNIMPQLPSSCGDAFLSMDQAADYLLPLVAWAIMLRSASQKPRLPTDRVVPGNLSSRGKTIIRHLDKWLVLFENMLLHYGEVYLADCKARRVISLLRLQHGLAWIVLGSIGPGRELEYDKYLAHFQKYLTLANQVVSGQDRQSQLTFTPELAVVPILFLIGTKCRHPTVRREVLRILRQQPIQEALWRSDVTARVVERVIEIEESGQGNTIHSMEQIPMHRRVEGIQWTEVGQGSSAVRVNLSFVFSGQEDIQSESIQL